jgi:hypothetical protein
MPELGLEVEYLRSCPRRILTLVKKVGDRLNSPVWELKDMLNRGGVKINFLKN